MRNTKTTKDKSKKHARPFHLHLDSFFRLRVCLVLAAGLLMLALARSERDMLLAVPRAYAEGAGYVGSHLSEERLHPHHTLHILRSPTVSSGR